MGDKVNANIAEAAGLADRLAGGNLSFVNQEVSAAAVFEGQIPLRGAFPHPFYELRLRLEFRGWLFLPFIGPRGFAEEGAIDPDGLAGNERGAGAGEKRDCGGDVGGRADSA